MQSGQFASGSPASAPAGLTILELLVTVAILSVLFALLLPGIQRSRESARRTQCLSRMRQHALGDRGGERLFFSYRHTERLGLGSMPTVDRNDPESTAAYLDAFRGVRLFECPSDPRDYGSPINFVRNTGFSGNLRLCTDGLDNTAFLSEAWKHPGEFEAAARQPHRYGLWRVDPPIDDGEQPRAFADAIARASVSEANYRSGRIDALNGGGDYTHALPPDGRSGYVESGPPPQPTVARRFAASSHHDGVVNVCFASGRARGVSKTIDSDLWWAMGTMAAGDLVRIPP